MPYDVRYDHEKRRRGALPHETASRRSSFSKPVSFRLVQDHYTRLNLILGPRIPILKLTGTPEVTALVRPYVHTEMPGLWIFSPCFLYITGPGHRT
jgi:hypothetical protein